ncbi:MAG: hypothetical protein JW772_00625 [Candidatus Diapherotrites archaeon]|nr:hypothetical protein [Candidatus Diapherotrites archaeon]
MPVPAKPKKTMGRKERGNKVAAAVRALKFKHSWGLALRRKTEAKTTVPKNKPKNKSPKLPSKE